MSGRVLYRREVGRLGRARLCALAAALAYCLPAWADYVVDLENGVVHELPEDTSYSFLKEKGLLADAMSKPGQSFTGDRITIKLPPGNRGHTVVVVGGLVGYDATAVAHRFLTKCKLELEVGTKEKESRMFRVAASVVLQDLDDALHGRSTEKGRFSGADIDWNRITVRQIGEQFARIVDNVEPVSRSPWRLYSDGQAGRYAWTTYREVLQVLERQHMTTQEFWRLYLTPKKPELPWRAEFAVNPDPLNPQTVRIPRVYRIEDLYLLKKRMVEGAKLYMKAFKDSDKLFRRQFGLPEETDPKEDK